MNTHATLSDRFVKTSSVLLLAALSAAGSASAQVISSPPEIGGVAAARPYHAAAGVVCGVNFARADASARSSSCAGVSTFAQVPPGKPAAQEISKCDFPTNVTSSSTANGRGFGKASATAWTDLIGGVFGYGYTCECDLNDAAALLSSLTGATEALQPALGGLVSEGPWQNAEYTGTLMSLPATGELWFVGQVEREGAFSDIALPLPGALIFEPILAGLAAPVGLQDTGLRVSARFQIVQVEPGIAQRSCNIKLFI